ncbi:MAG TPA: hypothetical protein VGK90_06835 [Rhizomicrobium sp.]|jgi:hypothetical protein
MRKASKLESAAMDAVAKHCSGKWEDGEASPDCWLTIGKKRIAISVATLKPLREENSTAPRLRFDRVVLELFERLKTALHNVVPDDRVVIVTVTAPIRLSGKTAIALEEQIRAGLLRRAARVDIADTIHGNGVRIRIVRMAATCTSKIIGFVHNPAPQAADILLDATETLLACLNAATNKSPRISVEDGRWLVIANSNAFPPIKTWRQIYAQIITTEFDEIVMVSSDSTVESLTAE